MDVFSMSITPEWMFLQIAVACSAFLYSSVGHGGASAYLAICALYGLPRESSIFTALVLNVLVSGTSFAAFTRAEHFSWKLTWPFILLSIPAAFLGSHIRITGLAYSLILSSALFLAGMRMWGWGIFENSNSSLRQPNIPVALLAGAAIGLISGMIGIGGGVFLSPLILFSRWGDTKKTAATSACFILLNSFSSLAARLPDVGHIQFFAFPIVLSAFLGGWLGSHYGSKHWSNLSLQRTLSLILIVAGVKLVYDLK